MSTVPVVRRGKLRCPSGYLGARRVGLEQIITLSGRNLTPQRLLASSIIFLVAVVDTARVSPIVGRVNLFSLSTTGSVLWVPCTSLVIAKWER
jgi:hypothetical protein